MRELYDSIGSAANQSLVERRMTGCSNNEKFNFKLFGKFDDVPHRMSGDHMRIELDMTILGHRACSLQDLVKTPRGGPRFLANLFDEFRHVIDLFHRNHVKLRTVLLGQCERQRQRVKGVLGPIVGV